MSKMTFSDCSLVNVICFVMNLFFLLGGLGKSQVQQNEVLCYLFMSLEKSWLTQP